MSSKNEALPRYQRNALAPSLLAAAILFLSPVLYQSEPVSQLPLYVTSVLAIIVAYYAFAAKQWWWVIAFAAIAVLWNPIFPFAFEGTWWSVAHPVAAVVFLVAGALIKTERQ